MTDKLLEFADELNNVRNLAAALHLAILGHTGVSDDCNAKGLQQLGLVVFEKLDDLTERLEEIRAPE
jgi:hypothetical protein